MLTFIPLTEPEYDERASLVTDAFSNDSGAFGRSVESESIFGIDRYEGAQDRPISRDHMRGYIQLERPCFNPIIAGGHASVLMKILGFQSNKVAKLLDFTDCITPAGESYTPTSDTPVHSAMWFPEYCLQLIAKFDPKMALFECVQMCMNKLLKKEKGNIGHFTELPPGTPHTQECRVVVNGVYWCPPEGMPEETIQNTLQRFWNVHVSSETSRLSYLMALSNMPIEEARMRLGSCIITRVMVVPLGMRPSINRHDPLSLAYNELVITNNNLRTLVVSNVGAKSVGLGYRDLNQKVHELLAEHNNVRHPSWQSIAERLSHKSGHIRSKMLGKRIDFSGRSVITIDPEMSLRNIAIPRDMAPKLYRSAIYRSCHNPDPTVYRGAQGKQASLSKITETARRPDTEEVQTLLENTLVITGRQPTLHKLSVRAFEPVLTDERSIRINPLCVSGFNADFDGDQMWVRVPVSDAAKKETRELLPIEHNLYYPKNGECSVMPRQEIIFGLNVCTREWYQAGAVVATYGDRRDLIRDLCLQKIKVTDTVTCNGYTEVAGRVAFATAFPRGINFFDNNQVPEITTKTIVPLVDRVVDMGPSWAVDTIDSLVYLGFHIAGIYPPTFSMINGDFDYEAQMQDFHERIEETAERYNWGWEEPETYERSYDEAFSELVEQPVKAALYRDIGPEDGFVRMAESGARGSKSNLLQLYGYKGRVQKNSGESFRAIIEHSYSQQLTPLEHFVTAYGGREGLITKSLNTADSGYAMRKMWHATSPFTITNEDCGTTDGITISKAYIISYFSEAEAEEIFVDMVTGRYDAETNTLISKSRAMQMAAHNDYSVTIRSPLTCKNPCCKRCYGLDLSNRREPAIGLPIGFIAAHSIGEPGTQLNMDSFKKGGLAGAQQTGVTGFTKLEAYIECSPLRNKAGFASYVPVAWATGNVSVRPQADGQQVVMIEGSQKSVRIPSYEKVREYVQQGEGICERSGDLDINELVQYAGIRRAQTYLIQALYSVYKDESHVNLKHLEVLALAMTMHMVISTDRPDLHPGQFHDTLQLYNGPLDNTVYYTVLKGVKSVQQLRPHALSRVLMESVKSGLSDIMLLGLDDPLTYPLNRIMMGLPAWRDNPGNPYPAWVKDAEGKTSFMKERTE